MRLTAISEGFSLVEAERLSQIAKGYTTNHDVEIYKRLPGELTAAAVCYALMAGTSNPMRDVLRAGKPRHWPWSETFWKPGKDNSHDSRIRELTKSAAMIIAEIDRLLVEKAEGHGQN